MDKDRSVISLEVDKGTERAWVQEPQRSQLFIDYEVSQACWNESGGYRVDELNNYDSVIKGTARGDGGSRW